MRYSTTVTAIAVAPDGKRLVVGGLDGVLKLLPIERPAEVIATVNVGSRISAAAFAHQESIVAVTDSKDHVARIRRLGQRVRASSRVRPGRGRRSRRSSSAAATTSFMSKANVGSSGGTFK